MKPYYRVQVKVGREWRTWRAWSFEPLDLEAAKVRKESVERHFQGKCLVRIVRVTEHIEVIE